MPAGPPTWVQESSAIADHKIEINTTGFPRDIWYPGALANALAHSDLNEHDGYDSDNDGLDADSEFDIAISSSYPWYTGTDGIVPVGLVDLETVVLHEAGHGLGMLGWMSYSGGQGSWGGGYGYPTIFDRFTENGAGASLINLGSFPNPSAALGAQLVSNNLYFNGPKAKAANGGSRPKLYAPSTWSRGSSYSHLDEIYNGGANTLMTYSIGYRESVHSPGPILMGIMQDFGWTSAWYSMLLAHHDRESLQRRHRECFPRAQLRRQYVLGRDHRDDHRDPRHWLSDFPAGSVAAAVVRLPPRSRSTRTKM